MGTLADKSGGWVIYPSEEITRKIHKAYEEFCRHNPLPSCDFYSQEILNKQTFEYMMASMQNYSEFKKKINSEEYEDDLMQRLWAVWTELSTGEGYEIIF
jgi:hypothetical protein